MNVKGQQQGGWRLDYYVFISSGGDIQWAQSINIDEMSMLFRSMNTMNAPGHIMSNFIACKSKILRTFITI